MIHNQWNHQIHLLRLMTENVQLQSEIERAADSMCEVLLNRLPILVAGNGGSASDALHFSAEFVGKFRLTRSAMNMICLNANMAALTAWANDDDYSNVFMRQVEAHGQENGIVVGFSTSGNSESVLRALKRAHEIGMKTICFTGTSGGRIRDYSDIKICVPSEDTPRIQELHVGIYHYISEIVEKKLMDGATS